MISKFIRSLNIFLLIISLPMLSMSQTDTAAIAPPDTSAGVLIDQISAIVGNKIVLQSEIEMQYEQYLSKGNYANPEIKCYIGDQLILSKLLLYQAILDSVEVKDDQVERRMDYSMDQMIQQFGSKEKMEEYYGKSALEWREELKPIIKDKMQMEMMRNKVLGDVGVSPVEIKTYFESFPSDSLPFMNAEVEYAQIVREVRYSDEAKADCKRKLEELRKRVLENHEDFATLAVLYSQDKTSAKAGGELGYFNRADLVPEFSSVAFRLKPGQVSDEIGRAHV